MSKKNTLWVEHYRPDTLENFICNDELHNTIEQYIKNQDLPHLLLVSRKPGSGKTSLAKLLTKILNVMYSI